ncbi:MAG: hypothetical protein IT347_01495 [Candidatus Eisenbacteria bacterium]|nr:hypothetical protein [Candidatus Eisenbacteria bacterium]
MSTIFTINFRREAFLRERARARRRAVRMGIWLAYFGVLAIVLGLYALNLASLSQRAARIERQVERLRRQPSGADWRPGQPEADLVSRSLGDAGRWRDRLNRLAHLLPANARVTNVAFNPDNLSGADRAKLMITGELRPSTGGDRMQQVLAFVGVLSRDSLFSAGYANVRLVTTRAAASGQGAEFVIECR